MLKKSLALCAPLLFVTSVAYADVPNDPCMDATAGDACQTLMGDPGTCVDTGNGLLDCQESSGEGGGGGSASGSGGSANGSGGSDGTGDGAAEEDSGCSIGALGRAGGGEALGLLALAGLCLAFRKRRD
jgi:uncharacterized membrane protein YgcG